MIATVLIVDDSMTVRMDLTEAFVSAGFHTIPCATVAQARAALTRGPVALAVLDVLLPDGTGIELLSEIRRTPELSGVAVLMLSTEAEVRDRIRGIRTGADDYVGKPYDTGDVIARAQALLRMRQGALPAAKAASILVVDDSTTFREELRLALEGAGYAVVTAATGEAGLRSAAAIRPAAVIVDSVMPGIDGGTVIRTIRLDAALRGTPCLLLTASDGHDAELRALEAGADAFVRKEGNIEIILARLAAMLRGATTKPGATASLLGPKRILAVDDSATYLQEIAVALREKGYDAILARSGEEAIEILAVQPVDCILLDLLMPGLSGKETCRQIKATPVVREIPLIILTALEEREAMIDGLSTGADDYISKSGDFEILMARIRAQLRRKQFEDENRKIREDLLRSELEAVEARAKRQIAEETARLAEEANLSKSNFLASMSHELRTPLNAILGYSELILEELQQSDASAGIATDVSKIHVAGSHLLGLINDILDLSKIEAGRMEVFIETFDLVEMLDAVASTAEPLIRKNGNKLSLDYPANLGLFDSDVVKVKQILLNLLSNAAKFTNGGTIRLSVLRAEAEGRSLLKFSVADSGIGIKPEDQAKLFRPFTQADNSTTRKYGGTGLGLAITKVYCEMLGGRITMESESGKGTTFHVTLPYGAVAVEPLVPSRSRPKAVLRAEGTAPLALVIDDDPSAQRLLRYQLERAGYTVRVASNGEEGIRLARSLLPHLITLDVLMPGMDGWEVISRIRSDPETAAIPVVIVSILNEKGRGFQLGASDYLIKPINNQHFAGVLKRFHGLGPVLRALVIEDDSTTRTLMKHLLVKDGWAVTEAKDHAEALRELDEHPPHIVITGLVTATHDTLHFIDSVRAKPELANLPIVVVGSDKLSHQDREELNQRVSEVLNGKGWSVDALLVQVRELAKEMIRKPS